MLSLIPQGDVFVNVYIPPPFNQQVLYMIYAKLVPLNFTVILHCGFQFRNGSPVRLL